MKSTFFKVANFQKVGHLYNAGDEGLKAEEM